MLSDTLRTDFFRRVSELESSEKEQLQKTARQLVWWESPEESLEYPERLLAQAMTYGTWDEVLFLQEIFGEKTFRAVLDDPPNGILDEASWIYWHRRFGSETVPPYPRGLVWQG